MQKLRKIHSYTLDSGASTQTFNSVLDPFDFSGFAALVVRAALTKTDTDAIDTCVVRLQTTADAAASTVIWNDRICLESFLGTDSASATTPETKEATVWNSDVLSSVEREFEESGSLGGAPLAAGAVQNGPFFDSVYSTATQVRTSACRLNIVVTDADADADFEGTITVYGLSHC